MPKKIDRKACFALRDQYYDCMTRHTAELFEIDVTGNLKCGYQGENSGSNCEKRIYEDAENMCSELKTKMSEPCLSSWIPFYTDRFKYRQSEQRLQLASKIQNKQMQEGVKPKNLRFPSEQI